MPAPLGTPFSGGYIPTVQAKRGLGDLFAQAIIPAIAQGLVGQVGKGVAAKFDEDPTTQFLNTLLGGQTAQERTQTQQSKETFDAELEKLKALTEYYNRGNQPKGGSSVADLVASKLTPQEQATYQEAMVGDIAKRLMEGSGDVARQAKEQGGRELAGRKALLADKTEIQMLLDELAAAKIQAGPNYSDMYQKSEDIKKSRLAREKTELELKKTKEPKKPTTGTLPTSIQNKILDEPETYQLVTSPSTGQSGLLNTKTGKVTPFTYAK